MLESAGSAQFGITLHDGTGSTDVQRYVREETSLPVAIRRWRIPPCGSEGRHTHPRTGDAGHRTGRAARDAATGHDTRR